MKIVVFGEEGESLAEVAELAERVASIGEPVVVSYRGIRSEVPAGATEEEAFDSHFTAMKSQRADPT